MSHNEKNSIPKKKKIGFTKGSPYLEDPQKTMKGPMMVETHVDIQALLYQLQSRVPLYPKMDNNNGTCNKPKINSCALEIEIFS
jgi:hypothetical protein